MGSSLPILLPPVVAAAVITLKGNSIVSASMAGEEEVGNTHCMAGEE